MRPTLLIEAAMVNPTGKVDRLNAIVSNDELNNEWVQLRNTGNTAVDLAGISLLHLTYTQGANPQQTLVMQLTGALPGLAGLRLHSGRGTPYHDEQLNIYHGFVNPKRLAFLFQIVRPDKLILSHRGRTIDMAGYDVPVPVNKRLKRVAPQESHLLQPL